jgi:hypothetical protein
VTATEHRENVISLAEVRAERRAALPVSLEMDWNQVQAEEEPWAMGHTMWLAVAISACLWAIIAGVLWFV